MHLPYFILRMEYCFPLRKKKNQTTVLREFNIFFAHLLFLIAADTFLKLNQWVCVEHIANFAFFKGYFTMALGRYFTQFIVTIVIVRLAPEKTECVLGNGSLSTQRLHDLSSTMLGSFSASSVNLMSALSHAASCHNPVNAHKNKACACTHTQTHTHNIHILLLHNLFSKSEHTALYSS